MSQQLGGLDLYLGGLDHVRRLDSSHISGAAQCPPSALILVVVYILLGSIYLVVYVCIPPYVSLCIQVSIYIWLYISFSIYLVAYQVQYIFQFEYIIW